MKQHIDQLQLEEITSKAKEKLLEWMNKKEYIPHGTQMMLHDGGYYLAQFLTIGQMIEFLFENNCFVFAYDTEGAWLERRQGIVIHWGDLKDRELCDALWEAVKDVLRGEDGNV